MPNPEDYIPEKYKRLHLMEQEEEPLVGKFEKTINAFADIDSEDMLKLLRSIADDDSDAEQTN